MEGQFKRTLCKFYLEGTCQKGDQCTWSHAEEDAQRGGPAPQVPPKEKKSICKFWLEGICKSGDNCTWAHGENELGMPLPGMASIFSRAGEPFPHKNGGGKGVFARSLPPAFGPASAPMIHPWTPVHLGKFAGSQKGGFQKGAASSTPKRSLCKFWMEGKCQAGDRCTWAHGEEDIGSLGQSPIEHPWSAPISHAHPVGAAPQQAQPVKRTICKFWIEGKCRDGEACTWAHGEEDIGNAGFAGDESLEDLDDQELEDYLAEGVSEEDVAGMEQILIDHREGAGPIRTKRTICKFWMEGKCQQGDRCTWAHGDEDLGEVVVLEDPRFVEDMSDAGPMQTKRTLCKFWLEGKCQKETCTWAHGEEDVGMVVPAEAVVHHRGPPPCKGGGKLGPFSAAWKGGKGGPIGAPASFASASFAPAAHRAPDWMGPNAKRSMCKFFQIGACKEGLNCTYAHGERDLNGGGCSSSSGKGVKGGYLFPTLMPIASPRVDFSRSPPQEIVERRGIKRSMCKFWLDDACTKGDACTFAHGDEDIGAMIPGDWLGEEPPPAIHRGALPASGTPCRFYAEGTCRKGASCSFAHLEASNNAHPQAKRPRLFL